MSDLTEYELARLARIERNRAQLGKIGLPEAVAAASTLLTPAVAVKKALNKQRSAARRDRPTAPTRQSKRLRQERPAEEAEPEEEEEEEDVVDYGEMPIETHQLDDAEFEAYTMLRRWRLQRHRELQIESYKIFQNRTLCEAIRRRRNHRSWARQEDQAARGQALLVCWGVGARKVEGCGWSDDGFGHELAIELDRPELEAKLEESRRMPDAAAAADENAAGKAVNEGKRTSASSMQSN